MGAELKGKDIAAFAKTNKQNLPDYWNSTLYWVDRRRHKVDSPLMARRYNAIAKMVKESKATVIVEELEIRITYKNGWGKVCRDILVDTFLIPLLKPYVHETT